MTGAHHRGSRKPPAVTERQLQVLALLASGYQNKAIGAVLGIKPHTVKNHLTAIYDLLGAASDRHAVALALCRGYVSMDDVRDRVEQECRERKEAMTTSDLEAALLFQVRAAGLPEPVLEHRFCPPRRWRFDAAWPDRMIAAECEGATWAGGRHTRGAGYAADCEKYNVAALLGWRVLRFTRDMIEDGSAYDQLREAFGVSE